MLYVEVVDTLDGLQQYAEAWDRLAESVSEPQVMLSHAWVASFLEHCLRPERYFRCFLAFDGTELVGALPLVVIPYRILGFNRPKLYPPDLSGFCLKAGSEKAVIQSILTAVAREFPNRFRLVIKWLLPASSTLEVLKTDVPGSICFADVHDVDSCLKTTGSFAIYEATLGKSFRTRLRRAQKKLAQLPNVTMKILTGDDVIEEELTRFIDLEASGWKGKAGGNPIKRLDSRVAFKKTLVCRLASLGWLEWHWLKTDRKVIAGLFILKIVGSQRVYKIAYDEDYRFCSPGNLLLFGALQRAFSSSEINEICFVGNFDWFERWQVKKQHYYRVTLFPLRPLSLFCGYLPKVLWQTMQRIPVLRQMVKWLMSFRENN